MEHDATATRAEETIVSGKYRLGALLGAGGMGTVFEAEHLALGERVALKFLKPQYASNDEVIERFLREARSLFRIKSENVVRVLDVEAPEDGTAYLVMELIEGVPLDVVLDRAPRLEVGQAVEIVRQICEGLGEAHRLGIVHRDVKPQNVMITDRADGQASVKLLDFGIAQIGIEADVASRLTVTDAVIGTPSYMSPEQLRAARNADARSDVWSVGVVFFELLTGRLPWDAASPGDLVFRQYNEALASETFGAHVPRPVVEIVLRCLATDPNLRFQDAIDLSRALEAHAGPLQAEAFMRLRKPSGIAEAAPRSPSRPGRRTPHRSRASITPIGAQDLDHARPGAMTFAREKLRDANGATAFERHVLVPRNHASSSGSVPAQAMTTSGIAPAGLPAKLAPEKLLLLVIGGGVLGVLLVLVLLLGVLVSRDDASKAAATVPASALVATPAPTTPATGAPASPATTPTVAATPSPSASTPTVPAVTAAAIATPPPETDPAAAPTIPSPPSSARATRPRTSTAPTTSKPAAKPADRATKPVPTSPSIYTDKW